MERKLQKKTGLKALKRKKLSEITKNSLLLKN